MIVADTNLIAYLLIAGGRTSQAEVAFERDPEWAAPPLWRSEFRNVLTLSTRQGMLSMEQAIRTAEKAESLFGGNELPVRSAHVLALASSSGCSAYDCEFVALAQELDVRLVTSDQMVLSKFPSTAVSLEHFIR